MIDLGLLSSAAKACLAKPRAKVTPSILAAVVMQESGGAPYFVDTKPGSLYSVNMSDAVQHVMKQRMPDGRLVVIGSISTGLTRKDITEVITIPAQVGNYRVPIAMAGRLAKFRFEYEYWKENAHIADLKDRFLFSCSWGLCQFMGPNISKEPTTEGLGFIKKFIADVDMQLLYGAGMIDHLLVANHGDIEAMYRAYNSGSANSHDPKVIARAQAVHINAVKIDQFIESRKKK